MVRRIFAVITFSLLASACASSGVITGQSLPPDMSTEGKLAVQGRAVVAACDGILTAADAAVDSKLLSPEQARPVALACRQVGVMGQRLATALRVLDAVGAAKDAFAQAAADARSTLADMQKAVQDVPDATRSALKDPVGSFFGAVSTLRGMLPQ